VEINGHILRVVTKSVIYLNGCVRATDILMSETHNIGLQQLKSDRE